ncbi:MAG: alpha/beta hydrolase [Burkholderiales bacterium]|nr:alpha/beta hydrolase [Burkholderiales bacterium]
MMTAAHAALPAAARRLMAEIGPVWGSDIQRHRDLVVAAYSPVLAAAPKAGVTVARDLAYGSHPRQVLDVFTPSGARGAPVAIFVHGGAFVRGDKRINDEIYDNVLLWLARQGVVGVNLEFRLAPEAAYPGGAEDLARGVAWVRDNIRDLGGDPSRIFVIGHSAGGTHVATYAYDPAAGYLGRDIAGIVLVSGRLRADVLPENPNAAGVVSYFGADPALLDVRSPVSHVVAGSPSIDLPVMIAIAEYENPLLDIYGLELAHRIAVARRRAPRVVRMAGHNHVSIVAHFNSGEDVLGRQMLAFFEQGR